ncbi:peptidoglycan DD-metalloendopeptidase family protein [Gallaecimonas kandeliae]|uniref:peptidoglycan DD-metalloendopeptidase family protein n=1 Tax=Gallaecimonas kandeliae TaxID=3029055 RepID=UPI0026499B22|nr:peptidoglycan DD-metalloendopeptidase family protein [Gallaecimonas kandeliae]WKE66455.1 peptidoglycan DD-metalloendopeptidase family protein [Gallaecimonas kandeliae]
MKGRLVTSLLVLLLSACTADRPAPVISLSSNSPVVPVVDYEPIKGSRYRVHKGDTLYAIAFRAGWDYRELASRNHLRPPFTIYPGQIIKLSSVPTRVESKTVRPRQKIGEKTIAKAEASQYSQNKGVFVNKNVTSTSGSQDYAWQWPTQGPVLLGFSANQNGNKGLDIGGDRGDSVVAAAPGKVVYAGSALRGYGKLIIIKHDDQYLSAYAHNAELLVKEQQWVKAGQLIARKGDSGSNGVKLHFEIRRRGEAINPLLKLPKRG